MSQKGVAHPAKSSQHSAPHVAVRSPRDSSYQEHRATHADESHESQCIASLLFVRLRSAIGRGQKQYIFPDTHGAITPSKDPHTALDPCRPQKRGRPFEHLRILLKSLHRSFCTGSRGAFLFRGPWASYTIYLYTYGLPILSICIHMCICTYISTHV